jgi:hypothetical protein
MKAHEFHQKKKELVPKIFGQISPLLEGMNYSQAYIILDAVREKIGNSIYFLPNHQEITQTTRQP